MVEPTGQQPHLTAELRALKAKLDDLYFRAGAPSARGMSREFEKDPATGSPTHVTVSSVLSCRTLPNWRYLEAIIRYLCASLRCDGPQTDREVNAFQQLWASARTARHTSAAVVAEQVPAAESQSGDVELLPYVPRELGLNCVLPHALDDQWVTRSQLRHMAAEGKSLADIWLERRRLVQLEFVRSLITAERIVINRSFLFRNPVITAAYTDPTSRAAFAELVRRGAVVIFLIGERDPLESRFAHDPGAIEAARTWRELARAVPVSCVRFSWNNEENSQLTEKWDSDFAARIRQSTTLEHERLLTEFGTDAGDAEEFKSELDRLARRATPRTAIRITRVDLYKRYLVNDPADITQGRYDFAKPHVIALKWLFDLVYNSNLATALGVALTTPADSAHRSVVHSSRFSEEQTELDRFEPSRVRTAIMETIQNALFRRDFSTGALSVFEGVTLPQVVDIRASIQWDRYRRGVNELLMTPWLLSHPERGLHRIFRLYDDLIAYIEGNALCG